jgi:hypothetical protein
VSGVITSLDPETLGDSINRVCNEPTARRLGAAGPALVAQLSWDAVVERLTAG